MIVAILIISIIALVVALLAMHSLANMKNTIHAAVNVDIANWVKSFTDNTNAAIPPFVKNEVAKAIASTNIPQMVTDEVAKHQSGALLIEGESK